MYGAQAISVLVQFAYAAITSRYVAPAGFGAYAIALSVAGLVALLSSGGIAQSVARMTELDRPHIRALVSYALILGGGAAAFVWLSSPFWASAWGDVSATPVIRWLAVSSFVAPLSGIATTLMRRKGSFRALALIALLSNLVGMGAGAIAVIEFKSASALVMSSIVAQLLLVLGALSLTGGDLWGLARLKRARNEVRFSGHLTAIKFVEYLIGNITKFSTSRAIGSSYFGYWNRADVLTSVPFQQVQVALIQAISPEFRHDIGNAERARHVWTDLLILVAWFALPLSALAAVIMPALVPIFFGPGWTITSALVVPLALSAGLQMMSMVLSSAVETLGRFSWMWITSALLLAVQVAGAMSVFVYQDIIFAMVALIVTQIARHSVQIALCGKNGYLNITRLARNYLVVVVFSTLVAAIGVGVCTLVPLALTSPTLWGLIALIVFGAAVLLWRFRDRLPPVILAKKYGLFGRES